MAGLTVAASEVVLHGGTTNRGLVVRVGDTVRRPRRPSSPATEALLQHLADVGFEGSPRVLGIDRRGRQVLSYIHGSSVTPPYPAWALTDTALVSVAALLGRYHQAITGFEPAGRSWPRAVPPDFQADVVSHNDPNLDNIIFRDGQAVALIDFDLAGPGSRLWDVASAVRLWAPLRRDSDIDDLRSGRALTRLRLFLDAYGLPLDARRDLVDAVIANHDWSYDIVQTAAGRGHPAFQAYLAQGAAARAARTRQWYLESSRLRAALGS